VLLGMVRPCLQAGGTAEAYALAKPIFYSSSGVVRHKSLILLVVGIIFAKT
jgi:hypothetical protein